MHLTQPKTAKTCGQHCLAMLTGKPLGDVIAIMGRGPTTKRQILQAASKLGLRQAAQSWQLPCDHDVMPEKAIVKVRRKHRKKFHWACFVNGVFHDPATNAAGKTSSNDVVVSWMPFHD